MLVPCSLPDIAIIQIDFLSFFDVTPVGRLLNRFQSDQQTVDWQLVNLLNVVFVTAFQEHAIRAFEANAVNYLMKPVDEDKLADVIERVRQRLEPFECQLDRTAYDRLTRTYKRALA